MNKILYAILALLMSTVFAFAEEVDPKNQTKAEKPVEVTVDDAKIFKDVIPTLKTDFHLDFDPTGIKPGEAWTTLSQTDAHGKKQTFTAGIYSLHSGVRIIQVWIKKDGSVLPVKEWRKTKTGKAPKYDLVPDELYARYTYIISPKALKSLKIDQNAEGYTREMMGFVLATYNNKAVDLLSLYAQGVPAKTLRLPDVPKGYSILKEFVNMDQILFASVSSGQIDKTTSKKK